MTRTEALTAINARLSSLDDERVVAVAAIIDEIAADGVLPRALSARERDLLEKSKADFKAGRSLSHDEIVAMLDERLAKRGVARSAV
jgi:hypothetical protein